MRARRPGGFGLPLRITKPRNTPSPACGERVGVRGLHDSMSTGSAGERFSSHPTSGLPTPPANGRGDWLRN
jgi:hypothetical protein